MSEATVRCPKCGHEGIVITNLLNSDLLLISDSQAAEIERLRAERDECRRLLREAVDGWTESCVVMSEDCKYSKEYGTAIVGGGWYEAARAAGVGDDE